MANLLSRSTAAIQSTSARRHVQPLLRRRELAVDALGRLASHRGLLPERGQHPSRTSRFAAPQWGARFQNFSGGAADPNRHLPDNNGHRSTTRPASALSTLPEAPTPTDYVSPIQDFWEAVEANRTTLGLDDGPAPPSTAGRAKRLACGVPESALRFTTTSYGRTINAPFVHSQEHQVTLKVSVHALPLQGMEWDVLREIVGPRRFNEERNELRLTSDRFGSRIENKRHLVSMLDRIVVSCQRLGQELARQQPAPAAPWSSSSSSSTAVADPNAAASASD